MKHLFLAAAAMVAPLAAMPALAQTTPAPADQTMTAPAGQTTPDATAPTPPADTMATPPAADGTMTTQTAPTPPMTTQGGTPVGGYQPSGSALSGPAQPGVTPTFQQAQTPDQAYPAPAPLASYPKCKPGQFDQCMQGAGSTHSRQVHRRARR